MNQNYVEIVNKAVVPEIMCVIYSGNEQDATFICTAKEALIPGHYKICIGFKVYSQNSQPENSLGYDAMPEVEFDI